MAHRVILIFYVKGAFYVFFSNMQDINETENKIFVADGFGGDYN